MGVTTRAVRTAGATAAAIAVAAMTFGSTALAPITAQDDATAADPVDRLIELASVAAWPEATDVQTSEVTTQGTVSGDFLNAEAALRAVHDDLVDLFVVTDDGGTPVDMAVSQAARGLLLLEEAYGALAEGNTTVPLFTYDEDDVFNGTDPDLLNLTEGWELLAEAYVRIDAAYTALVTNDSLESSQRDGIATLLADLRAYEAAARPELHRMFSEYRTQELYTIQRFDGGLPGDAPARVMTVLCAPDDIFALDPATTFVTTTDCPDLPSDEIPDLIVEADEDDN